MLCYVADPIEVGCELELWETPRSDHKVVILVGDHALTISLKSDVDA
jgi:hypothetical protein